MIYPTQSTSSYNNELVVEWRSGFSNNWKCWWRKRWGGRTFKSIRKFVLYAKKQPERPFNENNKSVDVVMRIVRLLVETDRNVIADNGVHQFGPRKRVETDAL